MNNAENLDQDDAWTLEIGQAALEEMIRLTEQMELYEDYDKVTRYNTETQLVLMKYITQ
jgi:hypothetical protein